MSGIVRTIPKHSNTPEDYTKVSERQIIDMIEYDRSKYVKGSGYYTLFTYMLWIINYLNQCRKCGEIEKKESRKKIQL